MNGRRRVRGWGALGCSNLTASGPGMNGRRRVARDVTVPLMKSIVIYNVLGLIASHMCIHPLVI